MKKKLDVLVVFDTAGPPPADQDFSEELKTLDWEAEAHVIKALRKLGHDVRHLGIYDDIAPLVSLLKIAPPDIVFNLAEHFNGRSELDRHVAGVLEMMNIPFTGSGSAGLFLSKNKALSKKLLRFHHIHTADFTVAHRGERIFRPKKLAFPVFIKPLREEASYGISQASFVENDTDYIERVRFIHESMNQDALCEEYIEGRELYVSVMGNKRLRVFPIRELKFGQVPDDEPKFASFKAKWDMTYRKRWGIRNQFAGSLPDGVKTKIDSVAKRVYRILNIRGYGRIDIRLTPTGRLVVLEANPNPFIADDEDFAAAAEKFGLRFDILIDKILRLGFS